MDFWGHLGNAPVDPEEHEHYTRRYRYPGNGRLFFNFFLKISLKIYDFGAKNNST